MNGEVMMFPDTVEEFMEQYKMVDSDHVYSNGVEFVSINRMRQWFGHKDTVEVVRCGKCRHYQGNHKTPGCAPCKFWGIGGVMWDDYCKRGERYDSD